MFGLPAAACLKRSVTIRSLTAIVGSANLRGGVRREEPHRWVPSHVAKKVVGLLSPSYLEYFGSTSLVRADLEVTTSVH
jgi:hypothetical protein